jgi:septum formation protein
MSGIFDNLSKYNIILASNSPRRRELLSGLGVPFVVKVLPDIAEAYPSQLAVSEIAEFIACEKAAAYQRLMQPSDLVITADTIVVADDEVMGKPCDAADAKRMLHRLSGRKHQVITGVCLSTSARQHHFSVTTHVMFKELTDAEIDYYVDHFHPFDKAGAYGIQEWIGYIGVTGLEGSYFNVMGLPVQRIYEELLKFL